MTGAVTITGSGVSQSGNTLTISGGSGGGGGTSGIPFASVYHSVSYANTYFSVNNSNGSTTESTPNSVLTWVPPGCTATTLNVFSEQGGPITVTLRVGTTPGNMAKTALVCSSVATGESCSESGSVVVHAGDFVDIEISGANSTPAGVWTALACN
jgi:hypothetical protein